MRRRNFLVLLGGAVASWPLAARAQRKPVIGYLSSGSAQSFASRLEAFRLGLQQAGYRESQNVTIEYRWADGQENRLAAMAADLTQRQVNVIAAPGGVNAALAAKRATAAIPIVFETGADPIAAGLVTSLSRPAGNVTGVSSLNVEVAPKRLELLHQLSPKATALALLVNPANPNFSFVVGEAQEAARALKLDLSVLHAGNDREIEDAIAKAAQMHVGGLVVSPDPFYINQRNRIVALAARHAVVAIFHSREFVMAGGLLSYGGSTAELHRQAGIYTGRVLKGDKPADLPIQQVTKVELFINMKTAKTLGLDIPLQLQQLADEVIE